jgi:hypothetical protein
MRWRTTWFSICQLFLSSTSWTYRYAWSTLGHIALDTIILVSKCRIFFTSVFARILLHCRCNFRFLTFYPTFSCLTFLFVFTTLVLSCPTYLFFFHILCHHCRTCLTSLHHMTLFRALWGDVVHCGFHQDDDSDVGLRPRTIPRTFRASSRIFASSWFLFWSWSMIYQLSRGYFHLVIYCLFYSLSTYISNYVKKKCEGWWILPNFDN